MKFSQVPSTIPRYEISCKFVSNASIVAVQRLPDTTAVHVFSCMWLQQMNRECYGQVFVLFLFTSKQS